MKDRKQRSNHPHNSRVDTHSYKNRHIWVWVISIVALLAVAGAAYFASVYFRTKSAVDKTYDPKTAVKTTGEFDGKKKFAVLLGTPIFNIIFYSCSIRVATLPLR